MRPITVEIRMTCYKLGPTVFGNTKIKGIICIRGGKRCMNCGKYAPLLCDYLLRGKKKGQTCDQPICERCAREIGPNKHYCPAHYRMVKV